LLNVAPGERILLEFLLSNAQDLNARKSFGLQLGQRMMLIHCAAINKQTPMTVFLFRKKVHPET
jgi:hypothetical protein